MKDTKKAENQKGDKSNEDAAQKTDFQGPVSLDAIFASKSGVKKEEPKKVVVEDKTKLPPTTSKIVTPEDREDQEAAQASAFNQDVKGGSEGSEESEEEEVTAATATGTESTEESDSYKTAQKLISLGMLEDFEIQDPEDEDASIKVSEFKGMTEENLQELVSLHKQEKDAEISSKYLPKGDLKEHQLKVFEILSNGGDLSQIAETPEKALERPFEGFDMDNQQRQVDVRYTDLVHSKGLDHESAITIIDKEVKSGTLKAKADSTFQRYRDAHTQYVDKILADQKKEKESKDLNFKENKKLLTAKLKESGLKESVYKKVASEYSKKDDNGEYSLVNKLREALDNPDQNHELILHVADRALFEDVFKIKSSQETQKRIVKLASGAASKGNRKSTTATPTEAKAPWLAFAQKHNDSIKNK